MNMRKIIAVLAAMLLLCAAIPMAAISVSASDAVLSLDFEDGNAKLSNAVICDTQVGSGSKSIQLDCSAKDYYQAYTYLNLKANTDYVVNFKAYSTKNAGISVYLLNTSWANITKASVNIHSNNWAEYTVTVNPGDNTTVVFGFQSGWKATEGLVYYFDDITVIEKSAYKPSYDGGNAVFDKDFEDGNAVFEKAAISNEAANGSNGIALDCGAAAYAQVYTYLNLTANTDYIVSFKAKASSDNVGISVNFLNGSWAGIMTKKVTLTNKNWAEYTVLMNPGANTSVVFGLQCGWSATSGLMCYFDDIKVIEKKAESEEPETPVEPEAPEAIYSEDYEDGTLGNWSCSSGGTAEIVAAADLPVANPNGGNYALKSVVESGKYPYLADSKAVTVEPNTYYVVSVDVLHTTNKWPIEVVMGGTSWLSNAIYKSGATNVSNTAWTTLRFVFNTGSATKVYMGVKSSYAGATFYVDNYSLTKYEGSADGYLYNGDFETGDMTGWIVTGGTIAKENGNYILQGTNTAKYGNFVHQVVAVKANTNYAISFKAKSAADSGTARLYAGTGTGNKGAVNTTYSWDVTNTWKTITVDFNSGENTQLYINLCQGKDNGGDIYFDDVVMWEKKAPSFDGYLTNGDFETRDLQGWSVNDGTVVATVKKEGDYAAYLAGSTGSYATALNQTVTVEPNTQYAIAYWYTLVDTSKNIRLYVHDGADKGQTLIKAANGGSQPTLYGNDTSATNGVWKMASMSFNSGDQTSLYLKVGGGSSGYAECYVDGFIMWKVNPASNDGYIVNGDFETGTAEGVKVASQSYVSPEAAKDGNFGLYMINSKGNWGGVGQWSIAGLEVGATYKLEMDMKAISKGFNWTLWQGAYNSGAKYADGYFATAEWTHIEKEFVANEATAVLNINGGNTGVSEEVYLDNLKLTKVKDAHTCSHVETSRTDATCGADGSVTYTCSCGDSYTEPLPATGEHVYFNDCSAICDVCGYQREVSHNVIHVEANAPTCTAMGNIEYWYCDVCGAAWLDAECTLNTNLLAVKQPMAAHTYDDCDDADCNVCGSEREPGHVLTYVEAVVAANCQETGHEEYWECSECKAIFGDAEGSYQLNPAWIFTTGDCVRPEGAADCAVVPCALCGNDTYGDGEHDTGVPACQTGTCSKCNAEIEGYGCQNYTTPICQDGVCDYCGSSIAGLGHENGAWAACCDGECAYGCGLTYPATEDHVDADADDYCDNCWNHLKHDVNPCDGGECSICWTYIEGTGHVYFNDCSAICEVCGYEREVSHNVIHVAAKAATCTAIGNIEYWYCDVCGAAWLDEACTLNTNLRAVNLPMAEHTYDNDFDADCNGCGATRVVAPVIKVQKSISEDVNGLAFKFDVEIAGLKIVEGRISMIDYTDATYQGYKLISMGAIASNGNSTVDIPATHLFALEGDVASVAYRVINIPAQHQGAEITMTPYFVVEIDGEATTIYGETVKGSYAEIAG